MNYLKQLLAFYDELEINPLNSSEIALWHALMSINNKTAWSDTFTVASSVLRQRSGLKTANFFKTRNTLAQKEYITWNSTGSNKAAKYQIKTLYSPLSTNNVDTSIRSSRDTSIGTSVDSSRALTKHKSKLNETETNNDSNDNPFVPMVKMYQSELGVMTPMSKQQMFDAVDDFKKHGSSDQQASEIIQYAIGIAVEYNKRYWKYAQTILNDWLNHSLFDLDNIKAYQNKPRYPKSNYKNFSRKPKEEGTNWDEVKARNVNDPNKLQERLAKIRGN